MCLSFQILLLLSYASSDKLDLTYLPPPGSQYSGGRPGDIQTPLEYPKDSYSTTLRPQAVHSGQNVPSPDDYKATIGINRGIPSQVPDNYIPQRSKESLNNFRNPYKVPTTTVSYAFTQTTTHPPSENFEATLSPIDPITGLPITSTFNIPSGELGQGNRVNNNQFRPNLPGNQQTVNIINDQQPKSGVVPQIPGSKIPYGNGQIYVKQNQPEEYQTQEGFQQPNSEKRPGFVTRVPFEQAQYPRNQSVIGGYSRQPSVIPSTTVSQGSLPVVTNDRNTNNVRDFTTLSPDIPNKFNQSLNTYQPDGRFQSNQNQFSPLDGQVSRQQYPGNYGSNVNDLSKQYEQFPNIPSTISTQGFVNKQIPTSGLVSSGITKYDQRPERLQAEADRNAVILNYKNVVTPEGFEYSFDTSNGIHMDENGTAIDGVKAEGSYSYTGDDGKVYSIVYTADENGFQPHGDHLPTPPPIPEAIQRLIEKANREKEAGIIHDGSYDEDRYGYKTYQGSVKQRPVPSDRITKYGDVSGSNIPKEEHKYPSLHGSATKSLTKAHQGSNKAPSGESESVDDFKYYDKPQEEYEEDRLVGDVIIRPNNKNILTPGNQRPHYKIGNKQNEQLYKDKNIQNAIRQRPFENNQFPRTENEESPRYPSSQEQKTKSNGVDRFQKPDLNHYKNKDDSGVQQIVRRPVTGMRNDNINTRYELEEQRQPDYKYPPRPATGLNNVKFGTPQPSYKNEDEQFSIVDKNNRLFSKHPSNKINAMPSSTEDYQSSTVIPSRFKPGGVIRPTMKTNFEQTISTKRRPSRPGLIVDENIPEYNQGSIDDISSEYDTENYDEINDNLDTTPVYEKIQDGYDSSVDLKSQDIQPTITNRPQTYATKKLPQSRDRIRKPQVSPQSERGKEYENVQYGQKLKGKPSQSVENKKLANNTGYQYIPPRNRFNYDEGNKFSTRYPITESYSTTRRPSQKLIQESKDSTAKPFLTPNVSRVGIDNSENDYNEENVAENERLPNQYNGKLRGDNYEKYTTPGQTYSGDAIYSNRPSNLPSNQYSSPNSRITQYEKQYSTPSPFKTTSQGSPQAFQEIYNGQDSSTQTPYETYSTTPISASQRPTYYDTPAKVISNPSQSNGYYTEDIDGQRIIGNKGINPSTSVPHSDSDFGKPYPGGSTTGEYYTTHSPTQATTPEYQYSEAISTSGSPAARPTVQTESNVPGNIYGNLPSTTYRPGYSISGVEQTSSRRPISPIDGVRRPAVNYEQQGQQYTPGTPENLPSTTYRPGYTISGAKQTPSRWPISQIDDLRRPSVNFEQQGQQYTPAVDGSLPSTTYQPGYTISGVEQTPSGRPTSQFDDLRRPSVNFEQQGQQYTPAVDGSLPSTTYRPGYTISGVEQTPSRRPISQFDDVRRPSVNFEQQSQQYSPAVDGSLPVYEQDTRYKYRPNGVEINKPGSGQDQVNQGYRTSTERIIGEDFSGPKQQQRFDPKLGYYY
ncbi:unnamed protein product [Chilo suppressalis]|uniref:Uncharacterized protein n=1 Tax=Chilo suppressalis TaxID=168631 RepID=A0ABN8L7U6_CHISP|nr:unnamed protein product [Chilo suppressalis]